MGKKKIFASVEHLGWVTQVRIERDRLVENRELVELKECLQQAGEEGSGRNLLLDCSEVQLISTAVLAALLKYQRHLIKNGHRLKLYALDRGKITAATTDSYPHEMFKVFGLDQFFDLCNPSDMSLEECTARMSDRASIYPSNNSSTHQADSC